MSTLLQALHNSDGLQAADTELPPQLPSQEAPFVRFPNELKELDRWVLWVKNKIPIDAKTGRNAKTTDPSTWSSYSRVMAIRGRYEGIGCVIAEPYVGIDLDKCRDPETGELEEWALAVVKEADSYTEVSPSGRGIHIWVKGKLPEGRRRAGRAEMYGCERYFTVTGEHLDWTPSNIAECNLANLHAKFVTLDPQYEDSKQMVAPSVSRGSKFDRLMSGEWLGLYGSHSEADLALCVMLAKRHNSDHARIDQEFRKSGLYRDKWEREDYRESTISRAVDAVSRPGTGQQGDYESEQSRAASGGSPPVEIDWRATFKSFDQLDPNPPRFLIENFLPEGITFIGGLPASGKTWLALSIAKALVTATPFLDRYPVPEPLPVLYLIPEVSERAFRSRLTIMQLDDVGDKLLCRTMKDCNRDLGDQALLAAVRDLKPVVFLDTAIRFSNSENENSASGNKQLTDGIFGLSKVGARAIVALHHSVKRGRSSSKSGKRSDPVPTLETALRGTGDFGAMCDAVWGLQCQDESQLLVRAYCLKGREFKEVSQPFSVVGRPHLSETGNFLLEDVLEAQVASEKERALNAFIISNPAATYREVEEALGIPLNKLKEVTQRLGWAPKKKGQNWTKS